MSAFKDFLELHRTNYGIASVKDQYLNFGGQSVLGISLRHFQQLSAGTRLPTEMFIEKIIGQLPKNEHKPLLLSYFRCKINSPGRSNLVHYLEGELHDLKPMPESIWSQSKPQMFFSEKQMNFLIDNPNLLRFYFLLSLLKKTNRKPCALSDEEQQALQDLDLIEIQEDLIFPTKDLLRIPTYETSTPASTALGIELIIKALEVFIDKRGSNKQITGFTLHFVPTELLPKIDDQIDRLRRFVKSCGTDIDGKNVPKVPIMFSTFMKQLSSEEVEL